MLTPAMDKTVLFTNNLLDIYITCNFKTFFVQSWQSRIIILQSQSVVSPVRNNDGSPTPGGATSRDLGGSSRDLGGSPRDLGGLSREVGASSSPIRSVDGSDLKSYSNSDTRSRERWRSIRCVFSISNSRWRSMARRGSVAEGHYKDIL